MAIVMITAGYADAMADLITPVIHFEGDKTEYSAYPGTRTFASPRFELRDAKGNHVSPSHYNFKFAVEGGSSSTGVDGRTISTDPETRTSVETAYGDIHIGNKAGKTKIKITATPTDAAKDTYGVVEGEYTVIVKAITPTIKITHPSAFTLRYRKTDSGNITNTSSALTTTVTFTDGNGRENNLRKYYDIRTRIESGSNIVTLGSDTVITSAGKEGKAVVKLSCVPKQGYETTYLRKDTDITVNVSQLKDGEKIKTYLRTDLVEPYNLANTGPDTGRSDVIDLSRHIKLYDEYGNEMHWEIWWMFNDGRIKITDDGTKGLNINNQQEGAIINYTGLRPGPQSGAVTLHATLLTGPNSGLNSNLYEAPSLDFQVRFLQRSVNVYLDPDPSTVNIRKGEPFDDYKVFTVTRKFVDPSVINGEDESKIVQRNDCKSGVFVAEAEAGDITIANYEANNDTTVNGKAGIVYWRRTGDDTDWSITFNKEGQTKLTYLLDYWPDHGKFVTGVKEYTFNVKERIKPSMLIEPDTVEIFKGTTSVTATTSPSIPSVRVLDELGVDITSHYKLAYSSDATGVSFDPTSGNITLQGTETGLIKVTVSATPATDADVKGYAPLSGAYYIVVNEATASEAFDYTVVDENDAYYKADTTSLGALYFTREGRILGGTTIDVIPGLKMQFGHAGDTSWKAARRIADGAILTSAHKVTIGADGIPTDGTYYVLNPRVNGYLTVWGESNSTATMILKDKAGEQQSIDFANDEVYKMTYKYPLIAGHTYYLYRTIDALAESGMHLQGLNFTPAFIIDEKSKYPGFSHAETFFNGYTGNLPAIIYHKTDGVEITLSGDPNFPAEAKNAAKYASVDKDGHVSMEEQKAVSVVDAHGYVTAAVTAHDDHGSVKKTVTRRARYSLSIYNIPVYFVSDGFRPGVGDTVSTENIPTAISMTYGGWDSNRGYFSSKDHGGFDSWEAARTDVSGNSKANATDHSRTYYLFPYASKGYSAPADEDEAAFNPRGRNTFSLPVRGSYVRFEPRQDGVLMLNVLQPGCIDYDQLSDPYDKDLMSTVHWRPLYIVDETGANVATSAFSMADDQNNISQDASALHSKGADTKSVLRAAYGADGDTFWKWDKVKTESREYSAAQALAHYNLLHSAWLKDSLNGVQNVLTSKEGGHVMLSKGYVRYTFKVKAGKTYFAFVENGRMGICGFGFIPTGYGTENATTADRETIILDTQKGYTAPAKASEEKTQSCVVLSRKFEKGKWTSLCLPFSLSETQFKELFGDSARIVTYDSIIDRRAQFTQHVYRMMEAGRPYFIKPSKDLDNLTAHHVTLEAGIDPATKDHAGSGSGMTFTFRGNLLPVTLKPYDYTIYKVKAEGVNRLGYKTVSYNLKPFHAYLENNNADPAASRLAVDGDIINGIDAVTDDDSFVRRGDILSYGNNVYDLQGVEVRRGTTDTTGLPAGIYVVNGKKILVK